MNDCEFCNKPLHLSHYENSNEVAVYDCVHCPVLTSFYFLHKEGERIKTCFMLDKNGRTYVWTNNYVNENSHITDVSVTLSAVHDKDPLLIKFPKIMNINPKNIHEKFSFYMTFL